jgi:hypothetical protein
MSKITGIELSSHARGLGKIACDAAGETVSSAAYDNIHNECLSVLAMLAKAGHKRSHELLNPPKQAAAHDAQPELTRSDESVAVGAIGL